MVYGITENFTNQYQEPFKNDDLDKIEFFTDDMEDVEFFPDTNMDNMNNMDKMYNLNNENNMNKVETDRNINVGENNPLRTNEYNGAPLNNSEMSNVNRGEMTSFQEFNNDGNPIGNNEGVKTFDLVNNGNLIVEDESNELEEVLEEVGEEEFDEELEGFSNNNNKNNSSFKGGKKRKYNDHKLLLNSILFGLVFFILSHPRTYAITKPFIKGFDKHLVHTLVFIAIYYLVNKVIHNI